MSNEPTDKPEKITRWFLDDAYCEGQMSADDNGDYVLYSDHEAEMNNVMRRIVDVRNSKDQKIEQLEAENERLRVQIEWQKSFIRKVAQGDYRGATPTLLKHAKFYAENEPEPAPPEE